MCAWYNSSEFNQNWNVPTNCSTPPPSLVSTFMKIRSAVLELLHAYRQTDRVILVGAEHGFGSAWSCLLYTQLLSNIILMWRLWRSLQTLIDVVNNWQAARTIGPDYWLRDSRFEPETARVTAEGMQKICVCVCVGGGGDLWKQCTGGKLWAKVGVISRLLFCLHCDLFSIFTNDTLSARLIFEFCRQN
jgi:hypothetical protein